MTLATTCKGGGIFSIGNINPLSITVGNMVPTREMSIAFCCESVIIEINIPIKRFVIMKMTLTIKSRSRFPLIGSSKSVTLSTIIEINIIIDRMKYGMAFAKMMMDGFIGDTNKTSIVPVSFSLTMAMAVIKTQIIKRKRLSSIQFCFLI